MYRDITTDDVMGLKRTAGVSGLGRAGLWILAERRRSPHSASAAGLANSADEVIVMISVDLLLTARRR
jgi:hypothetical protein